MGRRATVLSIWTRDFDATGLPEPLAKKMPPWPPCWGAALQGSLHWSCSAISNSRPPLLLVPGLALPARVTGLSNVTSQKSGMPRSTPRPRFTAGNGKTLHRHHRAPWAPWGPLGPQGAPWGPRGPVVTVQSFSVASSKARSGSGARHATFL